MRSLPSATAPYASPSGAERLVLLPLRLWRSLRNPGNSGLAAGLILLSVLVLTTVLAPALTSHDPLTTDATALHLSPGATGHPLGTDTIGRDLLSRTLYGGRVSLSVGVLAAGLSLLLGVIVGALAGMSPPWLDAVLMRTIDALLALPLLVVLIAIEAITRPSVASVVVVIGATSWMPMARIVRAEFQTLRERDYVRAAISLGTRRRTIALRHILPNALPPVLAVAAFQVSHAVITESTLSFLGLGMPPSRPTWGNMLNAAEQHVLSGQWWILVWPALGIVLTVLSINLVADGVRRRTDPRAQWRG